VGGGADSTGRGATGGGEPLSRSPAEPAILAFDIDGTVLDRKDRPVPDVAQVLRESAAAGVLLVPCTGRPLHDALRVAGGLGVSPAACVAYHGALVVDLAGGVQLRHLTVPDGLAARVALAGLARGLAVSLYVDDERVDLPRRWTPGNQVPPDRDSDGRAPGRWAGSHLQPEGVPGVTRLVLAGDPGSVTPVLPALDEARRAGMRIEQVRPGVVAVLPAGADKGEGLRLVAAHFRVPLTRVVSAGDDLNDITLLLAAGQAVAVGDAGPALRAVAGVTVAQGELAEALRHALTHLV
jgi:hypothetical protein